jgi:hypothetical protein
MVVDEIYDVLVSRFGVGEVFLPKWGKTRAEPVLWKDFITKSLELETADELAKYCGYIDAPCAKDALRRKYPSIIKNKDGRAWKGYLLSIIDKKECTICKNVLNTDQFSKDNSNKDGLQVKCKSCATTSFKLFYDINKEELSLKKKEYRKANPELDKAYNAKRKASILQASPQWANQDEINRIYKMCPEGHHVDHIVPLQNKLVCGLHCEFNLQHLPIKENLSKGNRFEVC